MASDRKFHQITFLCLVLLLLTAFAGCGKTELSDAEYLQRASDYQSRNDTDAAVIELKNALQQNPQNAAARSMLGEIYVTMGDGPSAEKELRRAIRLGVTGNHITAALVRSLLLQQKFQDAVDEIVIADSLGSSEKAALLVMRGEAYLGLGEIEKAGEAIRQAEMIEPDSKDTRLGLARHAMATGENEKAQTLLDKLLGDHPAMHEAWRLQALLYMNQANHEGAETAFSKVIKHGATGLNTVQVLEAKAGIAQSQLAQGKIDEAKASVDPLLQQFPNHPLLNYLAALVDYEKKDYSAAHDHLQLVISQLPDHLPAIFLSGAVNFALDNYQQAEFFLDKFINKVPGHLQARKLLAATHVRMNRSGDAVATLQKVVNEETDDAELLAMVGQAALHAGELKSGTRYMERAASANPENTAIRTELARLYMQQGNIDQAINELESITGSHEKQARILLVLAHLRKNNVKEARDLAVQLAEETPNDPVLETLLGGIDLFEGKRESARQHYDKALELDKKYVPAIMNIGRMNLEDGLLDDAKNRFEEVLKLDDKNILSIMAMAQISEQQGDINQAVSWMEKARSLDSGVLLPRLLLGRYYLNSGDIGKASEIAQEAIAKHADNDDVQLLFGQTQLRRGDAKGALSTYQELAKKISDVPGVHLGLAQAQATLGKFDEARKSLQSALKLKPDFVQASVMLGRVELSAGNSADAMRIAEKLIKEFSDLSAGHELAGDTFMARKKFTEAQKSYQSGLDKQASTIMVNKLSNAYSASGEHRKSIEVLKSWLEKNSGDGGSRLALALKQQETGEIKEAIVHYEKVLEAIPDNIIALNNLAVLYFPKDSEKALGYAQKANDLSPGNAAIMDTLGWILVRQGKVEQGLMHLKQAASENDDPAIHYHLAAGLAKSGDSDQARSELKKILDSGRAFDEQEDARSLLESLKSR